MRLWDAKRRELRRRAIRDQARHHFTAAGQPRRHHCQLQRVGDDIALADRRVQRLALAPVAFFGIRAITALLPCLVRHDALGLAGQRQRIFLAQPQPAGHGGDGINAHLAPHDIEIGVAGQRQRPVHVDPAMAAPCVAMPGVVAQPIGAGTAHCVGGIDAGLQRGQRGHHLEGGAGRIKAHCALVQERGVIILLQGVPQFCRHAAREDVGIIGRHGDHAQHVAGDDIHDDDAGRIVSQPARGIILQIPIDGQLQRVAGRVGIGAQFAHQFAAGRHLHAGGTGRAAQLLVGKSFDPVLADAEARIDQQRVLFLAILFRRWRADIADNVGEMIRLGIEAREALHRGDAGQGGKPDIAGGKFPPAEILAHHHRHEAGLGGAIVANAGVFGQIDIQHGADGDQRRVEVFHLCRAQFQPVIRAIHGDGLALAIDDPAAPWRDQPILDAVGLGTKLVGLAFEHGEPGHAPGQQRTGAGHAGAQQQRAARKRHAANGIIHGANGVQMPPACAEWRRTGAPPTATPPRW